MKTAIALLLAMAIGTAAQAETYIPKPFPKPPRPLCVPKSVPKPEELLVNLHCGSLIGDVSKLPIWSEADNVQDFSRELVMKPGRQGAGDEDSGAIRAGSASMPLVSSSQIKPETYLGLSHRQLSHLTALTGGSMFTHAPATLAPMKNHRHRVSFQNIRREWPGASLITSRSPG